MTRAEKKAAKIAAAEAAALLTQNMESGVVETNPDEFSTTDGIASAEVVEPVTETPTELVEDVVEKIEALSGDTAPAAEETPIEPETPEQTVSFDDALKAISNEDALVMATRIGVAFDERADFERIKDAGNSKIQTYLKKSRAQMIELGAAKVLIATNVDPEVFNRVVHEGARYNVYAIGKLADAVYALGYDGRTVNNAINLACMKSLFQFRKAGMQFTHEMAKCAASDKIRIEKAVAEHLVRHTVSASTAPTQASSTMQALTTLGIVRRSGSGKNPNFDLAATPIVDKLEQLLAA